MDPFSIFASVTTLLEVGLRASKELNGVIRIWKTAIPVIIALHNEVSDLNIVLDQTRLAEGFVRAKGAKYDVGFLEALEHHIHQAQTVLGEINVLIREIKLQGKYKKKYTWLFKHTLARDLQQNLRDVRLRINELLVTYNV
jgi:DUF971 family protein